MQVVSSRPFLRLAVVGALFLALGLAGCGRKGQLDPPPAASAAPAEQSAAPAQGGARLSGPVPVSPFSGISAGTTSGGRSADEAAPDGKKKKFLLDPLLN